MAIGRLGSYTELLQSLHQMVVQMAAPPSVPAAPPPAATMPSSLGRDTFVRSADPNSYFMSQVRDSRWNPNAPAGNANCGPASLAMALRAFGMAPPGLRDPNNPEDWIESARQAMEGDRDVNKLTSDDDVLRGAQASGLKARKVTSLNGISQALQRGEMVILAGNPKAYEDGLSDSQYVHFNGGHFILVTAQQGDTFTIDDPQSHVGALTVTRDQLQRYMSFKDWNVGVAVSR